MKLYDKKQIDWKNLLFDNKALFVLLMPIIVEQLLNSFMGMVDTMMVSTVGSEAISAGMRYLSMDLVGEQREPPLRRFCQGYFVRLWFFIV